ncbi:DUF6708 domain-containing protein [Paraburkholderia acidipaludis]|uniref:DUF6708 domain-containing protein n=1 Tax=Paraburkholderia acidipaludis TaxID=660537 RepID=UPI000693CCD7
MAWDGPFWVKLRRQLTDEEKPRQLRVDLPASSQTQTDRSVFAMNESWLEMTNTAYLQRGMLTYGCLMLLPLGVLFVGGMIWAMLNPPPNTHGAELALAMAFVVCFMLFGCFLVFASLWGLHQENFTWTRIPIRFNRQTRMVHAFRGAGAKGVISVPWERAFFFIEQLSKDPISRGTPYGLRCHVLDDQGCVTQSFSFGRRVYTLDDETTENGRSIVHNLNDQFEYIRRYMEGGTSGVPAPDLVRTEVSFRNSCRVVFRNDKKLLAEGNIVATLLVRVLKPFAALTAVLHYIGMRTSREPVWPADLDASPTSFAKVGAPHTLTVMSKQVALEGDLCQCKCEPLPKLIASQTTGTHSA